MALIGFLLAFSGLARGQATLRGTITDTLGTPLHDVLVFLAHDFNIRTNSDRSGNYQLSVPSGRQLVVVYFFGGLDQRKVAIPPLEPGQVFRLDMSFSPGDTVPSVVITPDERRPMEKLDIEGFKFIPNPAGGIEGFLRSHASVAQNNELSSQYSVRGGNFDENIVYINDIEIYRPLLVRAGQQEGLSIINTNMVENVRFSAGGFEARYGDKLSSVLDIVYKKPKQFGLQAGASFMGGNINLETASKNQKVSWMIGGRYRTNAYLLNSLDVQGDYQPSFADIQSYLTWDLGEHIQLSWLSYYGQNRYLSVPQTQETTFGTVSETLRLLVAFQGQEILQNQVLLNGLTLSWSPGTVSRYKFIVSNYYASEREAFDIIGAYRLQQMETNPTSDNFGDARYTLGTGAYLDHARNLLQTQITSAQLRGGHLYGQQLDILWGLQAEHNNIYDRLSEYRYVDSADYSVPRPRETDSVLPVHEYIFSRNDQQWQRYSGFVQNTFTLSKTTSAYLTTGLRANYWTYNQELLLSPRAQFSARPYASEHWAQTLGDTGWARAKKNLRVHLSGGAYHQPPFYRELRDLGGQLNPEIRAQRSYHAIAGAETNILLFKRPFRYTVEAYYKHLSHIIPYSVDNVRIRYLANDVSVGYATGVEMQLNGEFVANVPTWLSVAVMQTMEDIQGDFFMEEGRRVEPGFIPRPTDQRVRFSMFFQDHLPSDPSLQAHLNLVYGTGLPFGPPDYERYKDVFRTRPYRRVDIGFSKMVFERGDPAAPANLRRPRSLWASIEIFNLFNINNAVAYMWVKDISGGTYAIPRNLTTRRFNLHVEMRF